MASCNKFIALIVLFVSLMSAPIAQAQLGGLIGGVGGLVGGLGGSSGGLLSLINISGNVSCSLDGSSSVVNGVATPAFANALVQLQCGESVMSSARTDANGVFSILLNPVQGLLSSLLSSGCKVVVKTPLSTCNADLPSVGALVSKLIFTGNTLIGVNNIANVVPGIFQFNSNIN